jgi:hypothetical protein
MSGLEASVIMGWVQDSHQLMLLAEEATVESDYQVTTGEDIEALMFREVLCRVCSSAKLVYLPVVTSSKCPINPIINPYPMSSY